MGADPLGITNDRSSPYVEALRAEDPELVQYFEIHGAIAALPSSDPFVDAWRAAIKAGNEDSLTKMTHRMRQVQEKFPLGLIDVSLYQKREDLALALLSEDAWISFELGANASRTLQSGLSSRSPAVIEALLCRGLELHDPVGVFLAAAHWGTLSLCQDIIQRVEIDAASIQTALYWAVRRNERNKVDLLLDHYGFPLQFFMSVPTRRYSSALTAAAENRDCDMAGHLLSRGADPNDSDALLAAVTEEIEMMRMSNDNIWTRSKGNPPKTIRPVDMAMVKLLITNFIKRYPQGVKGYGVSALEASIRTGRVDITNYLINKQIGVSLPGAALGDCGESVFTEAIESCHENRLSVLEKNKKLQAGADPNCRIITDFEIKTPLLEAIPTRNIAMLEPLIKYNADVNFPARGGIRRTPVQKAAEVGDIGVVQFLIGRGADINARPAMEHGGTALQLAAMSGWAGIVDLLLRKGAHVNASGARLGGRTALEAAAEHGRLDTIQILINAGAGVGERGPEQVKRAIKFAKDNGHVGVYELLENRFGKFVSPEEELVGKER